METGKNNLVNRMLVLAPPSYKRPDDAESLIVFMGTCNGCVRLQRLLVALPGLCLWSRLVVGLHQRGTGHGCWRWCDKHAQVAALCWFCSVFLSLSWINSSDSMTAVGSRDVHGSRPHHNGHSLAPRTGTLQSQLRGDAALNPMGETWHAPGVHQPGRA